jgi:hypothetical protein
MGQSIPRDKKSQSALEYMMTYGWAIMIIVIVVAVLYSLGIFNPSSSVPSTTVVGFGGLNGITGECLSNSGLVMQVGNIETYNINITAVNYTINTGSYSISPNSKTSEITPDGTTFLILPSACPAAGDRFSVYVSITYIAIGEPLATPTTTSGTISGTAISQKYVGSFDGSTSYIQINNINLGNTITVSFWAKGSNYDGRIPFSVDSNLYGTLGPDVYFACGMINWNKGNGCVNNFSSSSYPNSNWHNFVVVDSYSGSSAKLYVDGKYVGSAASYLDPTSTNRFIRIGAYAAGGYYFPGDMAGVTVYSVALSSSQISTVYSGGFGGAPVLDAGLVGWWPLNDNALDYSGIGNTGVATDVSWVAT